MCRIKIVAQKKLRREFLPAAFVFFSMFCSAVELYPQESKVTDNGVIITKPAEEKVADEDVKRIQRLDEESALEDKAIGAGGLGFFDELDDLFSDAEDSETAITTPTTETVKVDPKDKPITFSGSLKAELGGNFWLDPLKKSSPLASFRNVLKFTGRPSTDFFVTGSLLMDFQDMKDGHDMDIGLYELYFDYTLFGLVDIAAGKRDLSWSLSRMLDTNILDDTREKLAENRDEVVQGILYTRDRTTTDSKFTVNFNIPILSYGSIQGIMQYQPFANKNVTDDSEEEKISFTTKNISFAGKVEGSIGKFSLGVFGMIWAENMPDETKPNPALGVELVSTILGKNSNVFIQGLWHFAPNEAYNANRARLSTGVYKYWQNPLMLGVAFEYQGVWDKEQFGSDLRNRGDWEHYFASQIAWSHFIGGNKWTFGCEWFHDVREEYGTFLPVLKIENIIKYTDFRLAIPIYYGSEKKYGVIFEVILNLDY